MVTYMNSHQVSNNNITVPAGSNDYSSNCGHITYFKDVTGLKVSVKVLTKLLENFIQLHT